MKVFPTRRSKIDSTLVEDFKDAESGEEYRYAYAEEHLNTWIALQIKALREQRGLKQSELAALIGTKQPGIARLENVNYSKWNTETLKKVARALGVRLKITFETFGSLLDEDAEFDRAALQRPLFEDDPAFNASEILRQSVASGIPSSLGEFKPTTPLDPSIARKALAPQRSPQVSPEGVAPEDEAAQLTSAQVINFERGKK